MSDFDILYLMNGFSAFFPSVIYLRSFCAKNEIELNLHNNVVLRSKDFFHLTALADRITTNCRKLNSHVAWRRGALKFFQEINYSSNRIYFLNDPIAR